MFSLSCTLNYCALIIMRGYDTFNTELFKKKDAGIDFVFSTLFVL